MATSFCGDINLNEPDTDDETLSPDSPTFFNRGLDVDLNELDTDDETLFLDSPSLFNGGLDFDLNEPDTDDETLFLDSPAFFFNRDVDLNVPDNEFSESEHSFLFNDIADQYEDSSEQPESSIRMVDLNVESDPMDLTVRFGRDDHVNFVMDLVHQRVEQSQVIESSYLPASEVVVDLSIPITEENNDLGRNDFKLELNVEPHHESKRRCLSRDNGEFMHGHSLCGIGNEYYIRWRDSGSGSGGSTSSTVNGTERVENIDRVLGCYDSDEDENNDVLGFDLNSEGEHRLDHFLENDGGAEIPLRWDSLQLEDFESDNVNDWAHEGEDFSQFLRNEGPDSVSPASGVEEYMSRDSSEGHVLDLHWQLIFGANDLQRHTESETFHVPYFDDNDYYIHPAELEHSVFFEQFAENETAVISQRPASKAVVQNLPSLVLTQENMEKNNAVCAVCKDKINMGQQAKQLPCAHGYHDDCILPWLEIRNTCPLCRYELATDDAVYEHIRTQRNNLS